MISGMSAPSCSPAALAAKEAGNKAFAAGDYEGAVVRFTEAIGLDPYSAVLRSNRAGALASLGRHAEALADAELCVHLQPDWWKGYSRRGNAFYNLGRLTESEQSFQESLRLNPAEPSVIEALARFGRQPASSSTFPATSSSTGSERQASGPCIWQSTSATSLPTSGLRGAAAGEAGPRSDDVQQQNAQCFQGSSDVPYDVEARVSSKERLSRGEQLLVKRRRWLEEWDSWDDEQLLWRLKKLGWDAEGFAREDIVELLLQAETDHFHTGWCSPRGLQALGVICTSALMLGTFGGLSAWFVLSNN